jgi:HEPN domain-containing protein
VSKIKMKEELASWYVSRAYYSYRQAQRLFSLFDYVESTISSYETIEFSIKAMCKLSDVCFKREHFIDAETLSILAEKVGMVRPGDKYRILQAIPIILSYSEDLRNISRYGIERQGVPSVSPKRIFGRSYAVSVLEDARSLCNILRNMEIRRRWNLKQK